MCRPVADQIDYGISCYQLVSKCLRLLTIKHTLPPKTSQTIFFYIITWTYAIWNKQNCHFITGLLILDIWWVRCFIMVHKITSFHTSTGYWKRCLLFVGLILRTISSQSNSLGLQFGDCGACSHHPSFLFICLH